MCQQRTSHYVKAIYIAILNSPCRCIPIPMDHPCYGELGKNYYILSEVSQTMVDLTVKTLNIGFTLLKNLNPPAPDKCISSIKHITCFIATPPCNADTDLLFDFCQDSCTAHKRLLNDELCVPTYNFFAGFQMQSNQPELVASLDLLFSFKCNVMSSYFFFNSSLIDRTQCIDIFNPGEAGKSSYFHTQLYMMGYVIIITALLLLTPFLSLSSLMHRTDFIKAKSVSLIMYFRGIM